MNSDDRAAADEKAPDVTYVSGARRSNQPKDTEEVQSAARVLDQSEHVEWDQEAGQIRLHVSEGGRQEVVATFGSTSRSIRRLTIQRFYTDTGRPGQDSISFDANEARAVIKLLEDIASGASQPTDTTVVDTAVLNALMKDHKSLEKLYEQGGRERLEALIRTDASAHDVVASAARRAQAAEFRRLLDDPSHFAAEAKAASGPERVWQHFFERNEWVFGLGLCHTFLRSWDPARLEQTTTGKSVAGDGKRVDALMETTGFVRSLCFVEIKEHAVQLLQPDSNRAGVWAPSRPLVEAVAQIQRTVDEAAHSIGKHLEGRDPDGYLTGQRVHLVYPRSFLVIGSMKDLTSGQPGGEHEAKVRSFELYRGTLAYPEIVTYDELLARAEYIVGDRAQPDSGSLRSR